MYKRILALALVLMGLSFSSAFMGCAKEEEAPAPTEEKADDAGGDEEAAE